MKTSKKKTMVFAVCCFLLGQMLLGAGVSSSDGEASPSLALQQFPAPVISSAVPSEVSFFGTSPQTPEQARPYFDYFSWQIFVALSWQAQVGTDGRAVRGQPSSDSTINSAGTRVWESWKADWELFRPNGAQPTDWSSYSLNPQGSSNPCGQLPSGARLFAMISKMDSIIDGYNQAFTGPLIDQHRNYVRYEIHLNKDYYDTATSKGWYLMKNVSRDPSKPNEFPNGTVDVKGAWRQLTPAEVSGNRFYMVDAMLVDPGTKKCVGPVKMGLVGFHIATKTARFREWVWSTFEHVDNVPEPGRTPPATGYSFNNGTNNPQTVNGYDYPPGDFDASGKQKLPCKLPCTTGGPSQHLAPCPINDSDSLPPASSCLRTPVQTTRLTPISPSGQASPTTDQTNARWQQALKGTVWANYELIATQWPTEIKGEFFQVKKPRKCPDPTNPLCAATGVYPKNADSPFPERTQYSGTVPGVANITMETYYQNTNSCIECHYGASQDDFTFMLAQKAYTPPTLAQKRAGKTAKQRSNPDPVLENLRQMLPNNLKR
jgi:hypothetical protein